ncbi:hypothetical protein CDAR_219051 [Caerostris darwini]|uniref:Uncharacterized protein n=1 Tax=Caerostris darwini TaxID=1538125 RepID=A0AAV4VQE0_9ARAC|nr:hypothetical protein CDAR_219051 [Caerostris darwini]
MHIKHGLFNAVVNLCLKRGPSANKVQNSALKRFSNCIPKTGKYFHTQIPSLGKNSKPPVPPSPLYEVIKREEENYRFSPSKTSAGAGKEALDNGLPTPLYEQAVQLE